MKCLHVSVLLISPSLHVCLGQVHFPSFGPDTNIVSGGNDKNICIWDLDLHMANTEEEEELVQAPVTTLKHGHLNSCFFIRSFRFFFLFLRKNIPLNNYFYPFIRPFQHLTIRSFVRSFIYSFKND